MPIEVLEKTGATTVLLALLFSGEMIFSELARRGINKGTLNERLKEFKSAQLITEHKEKRLPFKRKIKLTKKGRYIAELVNSIDYHLLMFPGDW
jgi:DNA-binding HxlR family transcriptional regulator